MDIETAQGLVTSAPPTVSELRQRLAEHHASEPQRAMLADHALMEAEAAIERLASLGHRFYLSEEAATPVVEFPRMLYRASPQGAETLIVESELEQEKALKDGWRLSQVAPAPAPEPEPASESASPPAPPPPTVKVTPKSPEPPDEPPATV